MLHGGIFCAADWSLKAEGISIRCASWHFGSKSKAGETMNETSIGESLKMIFRRVRVTCPCRIFLWQVMIRNLILCSGRTRGGFLNGGATLNLQRSWAIFPIFSTRLL
jgi:hypothetical protein